MNWLFRDLMRNEPSCPREPPEAPVCTDSEERGIESICSKLTNGEYFNVDSTWDAGKSEYDFFMLSDENFIRHKVSSICTGKRVSIG